MYIWEHTDSAQDRNWFPREQFCQPCAHVMSCDPDQDSQQYWESPPKKSNFVIIVKKKSPLFPPLPLCSPEVLRRPQSAGQQTHSSFQQLFQAM